jgi:predicted N-acetyltransferase YhbS
MIILDRETPSDAPQIEALLDRAFGSGRRAKTAQRLRDGLRPAEGLALVARDLDAPWGERLVGTLTFWDILAGPATPALLLGPLAVDADYRSQGLGRALILRGLDLARALGHRAVILVGDAPYYGRFGFRHAPVERLAMPGPVDRARFLGLELEPGALTHVAGILRPAGRPVVEALPLAA